MVAITAALKLVALFKGAGLINQPHPFLPGSFRDWIVVSLLAEVAVLISLPLFGLSFFFRLCVGLGIVFISYHVMQLILGVNSPCPCLGGVVSSSPQIERLLTTLLACMLLLLGLLGIVQPGAEIAERGNSWFGFLPSALALWFGCGAFVLWRFSGVSLGGDEGMEAVKALLFSSRPDQIAAMWNDQPPLMSYFWAEVVNLWGPSFMAGRISSVVLGSLLPIAVFCSLRRAGLGLAAVLTVPLIWAMCFVTVGSMMLESPAYSVGLSAVIPLTFSISAPALVCSVMMAALALNLKLTAGLALVLPFAVVLLADRRTAWIWGCAVVFVTIIISSLTPGFSWAAMKESHLAPVQNAASFDGKLLTFLWFPLGLSALCVVRRISAGLTAAITPWVLTFCFALVVHCFHSPFWEYYDIHLAVPVCVLASVSLIDIWRSVGFVRYGGTLASLIFGALWMFQQSRSFDHLRMLGTFDVSDRNPVLVRMKEYLTENSTVLSFPNHFAFLTGHTTPPEITVIPLKRIWAGGISHEEIFAATISNRISVVAIPSSVLKMPAWAGYTNYFSVALVYGPTTVLVEKRILPEDRSDARVGLTLKGMGL